MCFEYTFCNFTCMGVEGMNLKCFFFGERQMVWLKLLCIINVLYVYASCVCIREARKQRQLYMIACSGKQSRKLLLRILNRFQSMYAADVIDIPFANTRS